jgi:hypothetical protein
MKRNFAFCSDEYGDTLNAKKRRFILDSRLARTNNLINRRNRKRKLSPPKLKNSYNPKKQKEIMTIIPAYKCVYHENDQSICNIYGCAGFHHNEQPSEQNIFSYIL